MATIIDVARRAGVSIKTVSRVLNQSENVRAELRGADGKAMLLTNAVYLDGR